MELSTPSAPDPGPAPCLPSCAREQALREFERLVGCIKKPEAGALDCAAASRTLLPSFIVSDQDQALFNAASRVFNGMQ